MAIAQLTVRIRMALVAEAVLLRPGDLRRADRRGAKLGPRDPYDRSRADGESTGQSPQRDAPHLAFAGALTIMHPHHYRDLVLRAAAERSGKTMDLIVAQLADAERAREILRPKGYGASGMSASATAAQVPKARS